MRPSLNVIEFISVKLQRPVAGLSQREIADLLLAHGVQPKLIARVLSILTYSEIECYARLALPPRARIFWQRRHG